MPDTGAPWNIPYVEATDLVSRLAGRQPRPRERHRRRPRRRGQRGYRVERRQHPLKTDTFSDSSTVVHATSQG